MHVKTNSKSLLDRAVIGKHSVEPIIPNYKLYLHAFPKFKHAVKHLVMSESESELLYDWRFTANLFVLATSPLRPTTSIFFAD
jgi:hypothetical protein